RDGARFPVGDEPWAILHHLGLGLRRRRLGACPPDGEYGEHGNRCGGYPTEEHSPSPPRPKSGIKSAPNSGGGHSRTDHDTATGKKGGSLAAPPSQTVDLDRFSSGKARAPAAAAAPTRRRSVRFAPRRPRGRSRA